MQLSSPLRFFAFSENESSGKIKAVIYYLILGYISSLFIKNSPVITNLFMSLIFFLSWGTVSTRSYFQHCLRSKINFGLILFFILQLIGVLFSTNSIDGMDVLRIRLPLLILPIAFCLIDFEQRTWTKMLLFYAIITTIASGAGFLYGSYKAMNEQDTGYLYNDNISDLIGKQAVYMGLYVSAAIFIIVDTLIHKKEPGQKLRFMLFCSLLWLVFISFMLASKTSLISLVLILLWQVLSLLIRKRKFMKSFLLVIGLAMGFVFISGVFPKTLNRFKGIAETRFRFDNRNPENHFNAEYDENKWNSTNTRMALWQCGIEIWRKHPLLGTGIGDEKAELTEKYKEKQFWYALSTEKNLHNQYLDILVSMGLVGLFFFLFIFLVYPLKLFFEQKQSLAVSIFIGLGFCFFTENMLDRYQGEVLIAFILPVTAKVFDGKIATLADFPGGTY